jgi:oxygen-independent coproporphyrinogen-3 oxidase
VPFCAHHCGYCDFAIATGKDDLIDSYLDALEVEISTLQQPQPVRTLFLGGGTPTHLPAAQLERLLVLLRTWLPCADTAEREFSIECNPDSLTADKIAVLADHGVTRVSLGAQSFHVDLLHVLERMHDPSQIARSVERVRRRIENISLDLIFGVPGQTATQWREDLRQALALHPQHLSTYGLTYEKGTPLWKQRQHGLVRPLDEEAEWTLYALAIDTLEGAGFEHYEISSFARPGWRCRHNQVYWANDAYFGFGMGAARYVLGRREVNTRDLQRYIRNAQLRKSVTQHSEELSPHERSRETMAVQLRRTEGIDRTAFLLQTGFHLLDVAGEAVARNVELGLLADDGQSVRLTRQGKYVADAVIERLL